MAGGEEARSLVAAGNRTTIPRTSSHYALRKSHLRLRYAASVCSANVYLEKGSENVCLFENKLYGVTSEKTEILIFTAVNTSKLRSDLLVVPFRHTHTHARAHTHTHTHTHTHPSLHPSLIHCVPFLPCLSPLTSLLLFFLCQFVHSRLLFSFYECTGSV